MTKAELIEKIETQFMSNPVSTHTQQVALFETIKKLIEESTLTITICAECGDDIDIDVDTVSHESC